MNVVFNKTGNLRNESTNGSINPLEMEIFECLITSIDTPDTTESIISFSYKIDGFIPSNLTINNNGFISGKIMTFDEQQGSYEKYPKEKIKVDGSNWVNNGRPKNNSVDFNFNIVKTIVYMDNVDNKEKSMEFINNVTITVCKNNNIDNYVFAKNYFDQGYSLKLGNDEYTKKTSSLYFQLHPGPFGIK